MNRPPDTGPEIRERERTILSLQKRLAYFRSIPPALRAAEHADEGERDCVAVIEYLRKQ